MTNSKHRSQAGEAYLRDYPALEKWINQCVNCQKRGYKKEIPLNIHPGVASQNIRRYFKPLELNDRGLCDECERIISSL